MNKLLVVLFTLLSLNAAAQGGHEVTDLKPSATTYRNGVFVPVYPDNRDTEAIHFAVSEEQRGKVLEVKLTGTFFIFFDGKLVAQREGSYRVRTDSLLDAREVSPVSITLFQKGMDVDLLSARLLHPRTSSPPEQLKASSHFRDFVASAGLILIIFFIGLLKVNAKISADFFSLTKLFSLRDSEDSQSHGRFAISSNVGFYVFVCFLSGYLLLIITRHLPEDYALRYAVSTETYGATVWLWTKMSLLMLLLLIGKLVMVMLLSSLFGMKTVAVSHFFNWLRLILIMSSVLTVIVFAYFINRAYEPVLYQTFLVIFVSLLITWIAILFLKLSSRSEHGMFHLFSYICATEVIPILVSVKILFQ